MMDSKGIGFRSVTENIDTTTSGGKLVFHIFGDLAEFERSIIRERTRAGLDAARPEGRREGNAVELSLIHSLTFIQLPLFDRFFGDAGT
ncbi:MAG: recombinase family protein, partial [Methylococcales bacterium]